MTETVLVTGCSSGIGFATARAFLDADRDWRVYATARDRDCDGLRELEARGAELAALDLADPDAIERVVGRIRSETGGVDCLVNNAGYGQFGPVEDVPTDRLERQFAVHCFGPHRLIRAVLPDMRKRGRGRIITVTSAADRLALTGIGGYNASKWAMAGLTDALRQDLFGTNIDVVTVQPGVVRTSFYDRVSAELDDTEATASPTHYADLYRALRGLRAVEGGGPLLNEPDRVAGTILRAASVRKPSTHYRVGPLPLLGSLYGTLVPGAVRDRLSRLAVRIVASEPVLSLLERRVPDS
ncbi:SDR family NAD(P)-dependent oxidoreductase [Natronorubrum sp. JWXQ-INN-674]|uniref:SDR family NAD(P)-dependent oxidoreductase n=1 Tax=Natronorubrum halalkaliphilum TaxID=2691917 RepID=A0A6B0VTK8_9EURY|nr:SDR family oxidoreductase [Natronorubrum halalkaliphilum]MXV64132.1 SDR family NAD(P)-dependent oxidoreductase [Natronorubrum halalkaliphilum]